MDTGTELVERRTRKRTRQAASTHRPESPPLLVTKLRPPPVQDQTVARDRLVAELRAGSDAKLTLLAAPAGYGKTTLLAMWRELEEATKPVAWLTVDDGDNEPALFWSYVVGALHRVCPRLGASLSPEMVGSPPLVDTLLPELVNALVGAGEISLVLDDFHCLTSREARSTVNWFIDNAPSTFQLVLATRSESALPLAVLRAHGQLLELRARELSFTSAEAELFLNDRLALDLEPEYVDGLVSRTEGWPAGLYLAGLSLQGAEDRQEFASRFGGESRHVVDFLVDEVLATYNRASQELMLRSSILDRLCGPLCDAVLEQDGSGERLRALSRSNLFLIPLDDQGEWYRFHHLFARLLRAELELREPGLSQALHQRAFEWHRDNGSIDEAIWHLLEAEVFDEAAEIIAAQWFHYKEGGRFETLFAFLDRLPADLVYEDAHLLVIKAWAFALCARHEEAAEAITAAERGDLGAGPLPDGFPSLEAMLAIFQAGPGRLTDVGTALVNARRAAELMESGSRWWPIALWSLGHGLFFSGEYEEADLYLAQCATFTPSASGQYLFCAPSLALRSLIAGELGRLDDQIRLAGEAVALSRELGTERTDGEVLTAWGTSLAQQGNPHDALPLLERASKLFADRRYPILQANALLYHASALRMLGDQETFASTLAEAQAIIESLTDPGILRERLTELEGTKNAARESTTELSRSELMILRALTGTLTERDIGRELYLSHSTIHSHAKSIYRKLHVSSRAEAIKRGRELGLI
jgi:LuxR family maltose regulon positive regulatory protein